MPVYPGAAELTQVIRRSEAEVWLCTTRPYLRLDNVDPDTREWLRRNGIEYDALLFDPSFEDGCSKYDELARQVGPRVASVVDDLPEMITAASFAGFDRLVVRDQSYNRQQGYQKLLDRHTSLRRATNCAEIWEMVSWDINVYREGEDNV
jgi:hypothetical protein